MEIKILVVSFCVAMLSGFIHGSLGLGYGMIAMTLLTLVMPYTDSAALVSFALLVVVCQICWSMRRDIDWKLVAGPSIALTIGKVLGIVLLMQLHSDVLRISLGVFLLIYSGSQLMEKHSFHIKGTPVQGLLFSFFGGLFGGVFNVSGPAASIYYQATCGNDTRKYAACLNFTFVPSAFVGVAMHAWYGNFNRTVGYACVVTTIGALMASTLGVSVLKRINALKMRKLTYLYIGIMGIAICFSG